MALFRWTARIRPALVATAVLLLIAISPATPRATAQDGGERAVAPTLPARIPTGSVGGMGDVNLFPKRVVLTDRQRIATVGLYNRGAVPAEYEITIADRMMTADGRLVEIPPVPDPSAPDPSAPDPTAQGPVRIASPYLRYSPRRVALAGNDAQTVRIMARVPPDLPPGEYRSHFFATAVPQGAEGGFSIDQATGAAQGGGIGVRIVPRFGIAIPVIVRVGPTTLDVEIANARVEQLSAGGRAVALTLRRQGTRSAFGDLAVYAGNGKSPIAVSKGIGVYTELSERNVVIPLARNQGSGALRGGTRLRVVYTDDDAEPGRVLARQEFTVP